MVEGQIFPLDISTYFSLGFNCLRFLKHYESLVSGVVSLKALSKADDV